jgi:hypothetical protein
VPAAGAERAEASAAASPAYSGYVLGLLFVVYVFNFVDRQILSILLSRSSASSARPTRRWAS